MTCSGVLALDFSCCRSWMIPATEMPRRKTSFPFCAKATVWPVTQGPLITWFIFGDFAKFTTFTNHHCEGSLDALLSLKESDSRLLYFDTHTHIYRHAKVIANYGTIRVRMWEKGSLNYNYTPG